MIAGTPYAVPRTTFAVLRPIPESVTSVSRSRGTSPPNRVAIALATVFSALVFCRKNPVDWTSRSISAAGAAASAAGVGKRAKSAGVTMLTRSSVHCAERIVATRSCQAPW